MKKTVLALMAALTLAWAPAVYAADNGTEFGIEDDLTVLGAGGNVADPDAEIKGFTLLGSKGSNQTVNIPEGPGSMFVAGHVQVSSGMYVAGASTFSAGAFFTGVSSFSSAANIHIAGGTANQVLKKIEGAGMFWANDSVGLDGTSMGDPRYLQMPNAGETALVNSLLIQDVDNGGITLQAGSSMTVTGAMALVGNLNINETKFSVVAANGNTGVGGTLGVAGDLAVATNKFTVTALNGNTAVAGTMGVAGDLAVATNKFVVTAANGNTAIAGDLAIATNKFTVTAADGNTAVAGTLGVTGAATLTDNLTVNGNAQLGNARTDTHAVNTVVEAGTALKVAGGDVSGNYVAKFYSGDPATATNLAAWIKKK